MPDLRAAKPTDRVRWPNLPFEERATLFKSPHTQEAAAGFARWMTRGRVLAGLLRRSGAGRLQAARAHAAVLQIDHLLSDECLHDLLCRRALLGLMRRSRASATSIVHRAVWRSLEQTQERRFIAGRLVLSTASCNGTDLSTDAASIQEVASRVVALTAHLRSTGWSPGSPFPLQHIDRLFGLCGLDETAELAWIKRMIRGWMFPEDAAELVAQAERVRGSDLFDAASYARWAGIQCDESSAAMHYLLVGDTLGFAPSCRFEPAYYGARYADIDASGQIRLLHYMDHGRHEGRHPLPPISCRANHRRLDASRENVIVVVHETSRTGAPVLGWNIARRLADRYNVFTITLGDGPLTGEFEAISAETHGPFRPDGVHPADVEFGLRRLLDTRDFKYAIVNSCESRLLVEACATRLIPCLLLMHEFGSYVYARDELRDAFDMASEIIFPAQIVADSSLEVHPPLRERPVRILPQGMSMLPETIGIGRAGIPPALAAIAGAHADGAFVVLGAGSVNYRKGVDLFLATAMSVCREAGARSVHFVWVGHGYRPDEDMAYSIYLREQLNRSGLQDRVSFIGEVSDLDPIYALADAFLLSSRLDPMPNVSIDAAHRGIPIVCFRHASGTADILQSDPETAAGVVDYLDTAAAARAILTLARDRAHRDKVAAATRSLARTVFDMERYCAAIDSLGRQASERAGRLRADRDLLARTDDFDADLFLGPRPAFEDRGRTIGRAIARRAVALRGRTRRMAPGFNPIVWQGARLGPAGGENDPLADHIRAGRPAGPWSIPVLRPSGQPAGTSEAAIKAVLVVHITNPDHAPDLRGRLRANQTLVDLLLSTDTAAKAKRIRHLLELSGSGTVFVAPAESGPASHIAQLRTAMQPAAWKAYDVVGYLHDGDGAAGSAAIDFHWTALLGARHPMLDRILGAFASQPALGLVYPADPWLPDPDEAADVPAGGMFWVRRAVLENLPDDGNDSSLRYGLADACETAGLTQAVTHVRGVFV